MDNQQTKKIGIMTHYDVHNHGAHLQLYALKQVLSGLGFDAAALQYNKNYDFMDKNATGKYTISLASIPYYLKYLVKKGFCKTIYNIKKRKTLKKFRAENHLVGEYYSYAKDLNAVVIGSDEIFSIEPGLNPCFWGLGVPCKNIISYAASFGPTTVDFIKQKYAEEFIKAGIERISNISVRDENSRKIIEYYSDKTPQMVVDPVILYGFKKEIENCKKKKSKYILIYSYDNTMNEKQTIKNIRRYAKEKKLKIYSVGFFHKWCDRNINVSPCDIFDWFVNAEMVITDTFHGAVLSIVSNAPMVVKLKENQNKLLWLLKEYDLQERIIKDYEQLEEVARAKVDFEKVNALVEEKRIQSKEYLKDALQLC